MSYHTTIKFFGIMICCYSLIAKHKKLDNFDLQAFAGHWYETARSKNIKPEKGTLTEFDIYLEKDNTYNIYHTDYSSKGTIKTTSIAHQVDEDDPAFFKASMTNNFLSRLITFNLRILETDYDSYAAVVSKNRFFWLYPITFCWILSRTKTLDNKRINALNDLFDKEGYCKKKEMQSATSTEL